MEELSDYERQRLEHIKRNHEFMVALGLVDASVDPLAHAVAQPKKSKAAQPRKLKTLQHKHGPRPRLRI